MPPPGSLFGRLQAGPENPDRRGHHKVAGRYGPGGAEGGPRTQRLWHRRATAFTTSRPPGRADILCCALRSHNCHEALSEFGRIAGSNALVPRRQGRRQPPASLPQGDAAGSVAPAAVSSVNRPR